MTAIDDAGHPVEIGFNIDYPLDVLGNSNAETATLELQSAQSSLLLHFADRAGLRYVVSPTRL